MDNIILVLVVESIFIVILIVILFVISKRVNILLKNIFVDKMQQFDFLIEEREHKAESLNNDIEIRKDELNKLTDKIKDIDLTEKNKNDNDFKLSEAVDYEDSSILNKYKRIKEGFNFDKKKLVKDFVDRAKPKENKNYDSYCNIRKYFTHNVQYKLTSCPSNLQITIIKELLTKEEFKLIEGLIDKKFNFNKFLSALDEKIIVTNPYITVYTGNKKANFDDISPFVKTVYNEKIVEGIKIIYKGKVYDYSI